MIGILILGNCCTSLNLSIEAKDGDSIDNNVNYHIIEKPRVPYVGQPTDFYCMYASLTMIIQHNGINVSLGEVLHHSGIGYSLMYTHFIPIANPARIASGGFGICQLFSNIVFLASLYNLTYNEFTPAFYLAKNQKWNQYWGEVKENILNNAPVLTGVDTFALPYLRERYNISDNSTHGGHAIVLVGFNESNNTVCYNDPATALFNESEKGTYTYLSLDILKEAVYYTIGTKYLVLTFTNPEELTIPSSRERFEKAHNKNIERIKGVPEANIGFNFPFPAYGIEAVRSFKTDLSKGLFHRALTILQLVRYNGTLLHYMYDTIATEKQNVSQYLLENNNISSICLYDAMLLRQEAENWRNLSDAVLGLNDFCKNNGFLKTLILSEPILENMDKILSTIIEIEDNIIEGI